MKQIIWAVAVSLLAFTAYAHQGATGIVKERMDLMAEMGKSSKQLAKLVKASGEIDYAAIATLSLDIARQNANSLKLFPEGSMSSVSEAREKIWLNWDDFANKMQLSEQAADKLSQAANAKASQKELKSYYKDLSKSCKSCHRRYRTKK